MVKKIISVFLITLLTAVCFLSALPVSATETYYSEAINMLAKEDFEAAEYPSVTEGGTLITETYAEGIQTTGSGWSGLWSTASDKYTAPDSTLNLKGTKKKLSPVGKTNTAYHNFMMLNATGLVAYRFLAEKLDFDAEGKIYEFYFEYLEGFSDTYSKNRTDLRVNVGGLFTVGHNRVADSDGAKPQINPVIIVGETTTSSSTNLTVGGGITTNAAHGELVTYKVRVELGAEGTKDKITLMVQESQEYQYSKVTPETTIATVTYETDLNGEVGYIGFGAASGKMNFLFKDIYVREIKSCEANADCVATVNTSIIDGSVAFGKKVSADIDVESKSGNAANIISLVAVKNNNKLVGVKCAEATLSGSTTTGTMALSYAFSEDNGWNSDDFDAKNVGVSFIVWNKDTLTPYINKVGFGTEEYD